MLALKHKLNVALPQPVNLLHALNEIKQQLGICVSYLFFSDQQPIQSVQNALTQMVS